MTEIVAAHLERAKEIVNRILEYVDEGQLDEYAGIAQEAMVNPVAAALAACSREEALEWDKTAQLHISRWTELEWRNERLRALERAAGEKGQA